MRYKLIGVIFASILFVFIAAPAFADDPFGGPATSSGGNGTTTWGAIYIAEQCSPSTAFPAGSARWFKADAWEDYTLQVWLNDDPQWGAALKYFENNPNTTTSDQTANQINGFWLRVYAPAALYPNYAYGDQAHRADLLTTRDGVRDDGTDVTWVGYANNNKFVTDRLLWYEGRFNGWVYIRVENKMQWDNNAIVCTHRNYSPRPRPQPTPSNDQVYSNPRCEWDPQCAHPAELDADSKADARDAKRGGQ